MKPEREKEYTWSYSGSDNKYRVIRTEDGYSVYSTDDLSSVREMTERLNAHRRMLDRVESALLAGAAREA